MKKEQITNPHDNEDTFMTGTVVAIHENDHSDNELCIIGVATSIDRAHKVVDEWYGKHEVISSTRDLGECTNIAYTARLTVYDYENKPYEVTVIFELFKLNDGKI